jgi:hypothetical protein|tara:strand:- start:1184 stop:1609 length:426 start_codon:yes stop_codon:yes gene_type:complete
MELVTTLLGGSLMGFVTTLIGGIVKAKAEQHKLMLSALNARHKVLQDVREHGMKDRHFAWTRRIIALTCVACIVVIPFLAPFVDIPVIVSHVKEGGFSIPFIWQSPDTVEWQPIQGVALAPMYLHTLAAIVSFYFGSSAAK